MALCFLCEKSTLPHRRKILFKTAGMKYINALDELGEEVFGSKLSNIIPQEAKLSAYLCNDCTRRIDSHLILLKKVEDQKQFICSNITQYYEANSSILQQVCPHLLCMYIYWLCH